MPREEFRSERHHALENVYPSEKRYCACKQGRAGQCQCEQEPQEGGKLWIAFWFAVAIVAGGCALFSAGLVPQ